MRQLKGLGAVAAMVIGLGLVSPVGLLWAAEHGGKEHGGAAPAATQEHGGKTAAPQAGGQSAESDEMVTLLQESADALRAGETRPDLAERLEKKLADMRVG